MKLFFDFYSLSFDKAVLERIIGVFFIDRESIERFTDFSQWQRHNQLSLTRALVAKCPNQAQEQTLVAETCNKSLKSNGTTDFPQW